MSALLLLLLIFALLLVLYWAFQNSLRVRDFFTHHINKISNRRHLSEYPNRIFVESGTHYGDGVDDALLNGFQEIHSVEISEPLYERCKERFKENPAVHLYQGSSIDRLPEILRKIHEPVTFWLDGHYCWGKSGLDPKKYCPLMQELEIIKRHHVKNHTILIDDRRMMKASLNHGLDGYFDVTSDDVVAKLKEINPNYKIKYLDGINYADIIVAYVE